jgi:hypothetical protein
MLVVNVASALGNTPWKGTWLLMSISSMANVAYVRRTDVSTSTVASSEAPGSAAEIEIASAGTAESQSPATTAISVIATYIPTEVLTLYVAVLGALQGPNGVAPKSLWSAFIFFLVLTPVVVWLIYAARVKAAKKKLPLSPRTWPMWEIFAATVAYVAWAIALPDNPFKYQFGWYSPALAGVIVLVISTLLGLMAPVVQRPLRT